jgi:photosystem II stability/assembly factor-like uncharacterized protein
MSRISKRPAAYAVLGIAAVAAIGLVYAYSSPSTGEMALTDLVNETHIHGIAADPNDPSRLFLATHHGLFIAGSDGKTRRVSTTRDDLMGFTVHPTDPSVLYASGHPERGGNLGFIASRDGGRSWSKIANGVDGPVDFHQMDVSKADARVVYGVHGDLQRSADGGITWTRVGPVPKGTFAIAAAGVDVNGIYAATQSGLFHSPDGGRTWIQIFGAGRVATMVHVTMEGSVYAFLVGLGLVSATENELVWKQVKGGFGEDYVVHFASNPTDPKWLYAVTLNPHSRRQNVIESRDSGLRWTTLGSK